MGTVLFVLVGIVLLQFILNPILLLLQYREYAEPRFEPMLADHLPPEVKSFFTGLEPDFKALGFLPCPPATLRNPSGNAKIYITPWINRTEGISGTASVAYLRLEGRSARLFARTLSLVTRFSETTQVETSNSSMPTAMVRMPLRRYIQLPQLAGLQELLAAHQLLVRRFHPGNGERWLPEVGQELAMLSRKMTEVYRFQAEAGRLTLAGPKIYRLTLKGAVINGWQFAWPIKSIRTWRLKRRAHTMAASLETVSR